MPRSKLVIASVLAMTAPALAAEPHVLHQTQSHGPPLPDCYCRTQDRIVAEGEMACMATPSGWRMAECRMEINVMSWGFTDQPCPDS
jgi:hypothetical protein